jgi:hypothetical protein
MQAGFVASCYSTITVSSRSHKIALARAERE